jgi:hypothetical protein
MAQAVSAVLQAAAATKNFGGSTRNRRDLTPKRHNATAYMRGSGMIGGLRRLPLRVAALVLLVGSIGSASAQFVSGSQAPSSQPLSPSFDSGALAPGSGTFTAPGASLASPGPDASVLGPHDGLSPLPGEIPSLVPNSPGGLGLPLNSGLVGLRVNARFGRDAPPITGGLHWRVYPDKPDKKGKFHLIRQDTKAAPTFVLPPGSYIVHADFGLASAVKRVRLRAETVRETFDIEAGGLKLKGQVGDVAIPPGQISFKIYAGSQFDAGEKPLVASRVMTGELVLLPEGTYNIVSNYGHANAVVRSDIRVQAGKLTDVTVTHQAAIITLKLVNERGGEALANTAWSVLTPGGDVIKESIGAFPRVILADGEYRVIARNDGRIFEHGFKVHSGVDGEVEVLAR